jgi:hypothetical protein
MHNEVDAKHVQRDLCLLLQAVAMPVEKGSTLNNNGKLGRDTSYVYSSGQYWTEHPAWMAEHKPPKAKDTVPSLIAVVDDSRLKELPIVDVGGGTGATVVAAAELLKEMRPELNVRPVVFDIAGNAIERGR